MTQHNDKRRLMVLTGRAGCGKTHHMLSEIAREPRRYILAVPRTALIEEHAAYLQALSSALSTTLVVACIHSDQPAREKVGRRITDACRATPADQHAVIAISHQALIDLDAGTLAEWHVRIDELPVAGIVSGRLSLGATWPVLDRHYTLTPSDRSGWSVARPRDDVAPLGLAAITGDVAQDLIGLHRALTSPTRTTYIDVVSWEDASLPRRPLHWWSIWSPAKLVSCASVTLAAANYAGSLVDYAMRASDAVEVVQCCVGARSLRTAQPQIQIHYYTEHPGSTTWWQTDEGSRCLVQISRQLEVIGFDGYWTSNESIKPYFVHRFPGAWYLPKQAGSNALRDYTACAILYSAKAQHSDEPLFATLGVDCDDIQAAREDEDVYQFVMRGAIRNADYAGGYDVHVYDRMQATRLQTRLIEQGYTDVVLVADIAAGIMDVARPKLDNRASHTRDDPASVIERREQQRLAERERGRRRREASRATREAAGTLRPPGRPRRDLQNVSSTEDATAPLPGMLA